jgi:hypothetical protein
VKGAAKKVAAPVVEPDLTDADEPDDEDEDKQAKLF